MAFSVTPTSGTAPYTLTATFAETLGFDTGDYLLRVYSQTLVGSCPSTAYPGGSQSVPIATSLLATGSAESSTSVPDGSCRVFTAGVFTNAGELVSESSITVSNL